MWAKSLQRHTIPKAMKKGFVVVVLLCILCNSCIGDRHRVRRKVAFSKNSKFFFRLNGKANSVPWVQIFAVGYAVRVNYELPENIQKRHKFFKRDIHSELLDVPHDSARGGISCIIKHLCETVNQIRESKGCGFFCEIGNIISRAEGIESDFFTSFLDKCDYHISKCPYEFEISTNTILPSMF